MADPTQKTYPVPSEDEIKMLRAKPHLADGFDAAFGPGMAKSLLGPTSAVPAMGVEGGELSRQGPGPTGVIDPALYEMGAIARRFDPSTDQSSTLAGDVAGALGDVAGGVAYGAQEAVNETVDAIESFDIAASKKLDEWGIPSRLQIVNPKTGELDPQLKTFEESKDDPDFLGGTVGEKGDAAEIDVAPVPVNTLGTVTAGLTQFMAGFAGARAVTGAGGLVGGFLNGAIADGVVFDPEGGNLSNFLQENDMGAGFLTEALAQDPDDPEWMNRMRNVTEGAVLGGVAETILKGLRSISYGKKAEDVRAGLDESRIKEEEASAWAEYDRLKAEADRLAGEAGDEARDALEFGTSPTTNRPSPEQPEPAPAPDAAAEPSMFPFLNAEAIRGAYDAAANIDLDRVARGRLFNLDKMTGPVEGRQLIESVSRSLFDGVAEFRTVKPLQETLSEATSDLSDMLKLGRGEMMRRLEATAGATGNLDQLIVSGKIAIQSLAGTVNDIAKEVTSKARAGLATAEDDARLLSAMASLTNAQGYLKQTVTSAARATSAGRIKTAPGLDIDALALVERSGGSEAVRKMAEKLRQANSPIQVNRMVASFQKAGWGDIASEVYINNLLSGYKTHIVNVTSNTLNTIVAPMERTIGGAIDGILRHDASEMRAGLYQMAELRTAVMTGLKMAGRVLWTENPVLDHAMRTQDSPVYKAITAETFGKSSGDWLGKTINVLGHAQRIPGRLLMAQDEFFKQVMFNSRLKANLMVTAQNLTPGELRKMGYANKGDFVEGELEKAVETVGSLSTQWDTMVREGRVANDPDARNTYIQENLGKARETASSYAEDALRIAREATFTNPLDGVGWLSALGGWVEKGLYKHPWARIVVPFVRTPINILNKGLDRTPGINLVRERFRLRLNSPEASVRAEALGELTTSVMIGTGAYLLAMEGRITGNGPSDPKQRAIWQADKGWLPTSVNIGTPEAPNWVSISRLDPLAFPFAIAGELAEMKQAAMNDPSFDEGALFASLVSAIASTVKDKTFLQSISDIFNVFDGSDSPGKVERLFNRTASNFIPFSGAGRQLNQLSDGVFKEVASFYDHAKMNIPGMSSQLPTRYNWVTGEAMDRPSTLLGALDTSRGSDRIVPQELRRLSYGFTGPDRKIGRITLSTEMFQEWNRLMGTVKDGRGWTLEQSLAHIMKSKAYDMERDRVPDGVTTPAESHRVALLREVMTSYKQRSRAALFEKYPDLYSAWREYEEFEQRAKSGKAAPEERSNLLFEF